MTIGKFNKYLVLMLVMVLAVAGCGSDPAEPDTQGASPTVQITAPANGSTVSQGVTVTVATTHATSVHFFVDSVEFASDTSAPFSTIWNTGQVTNGLHVLRVRAEGSDQVVDAEISVTVNNVAGAVIVTVNPQAATLEVGESLQFSAEVSGAAGTQVTWAVEQGASGGTVTQAGLYTAPASLPSPASVTVRATSVDDPAASSTATVTLTSGQPAGGDENWVSQLAFAAGNEVVDAGYDRLELTVQMAWLAAELNGGNLILHGTLSQVTPGGGDYTYSATPADRLVLANIGYEPIAVYYHGFNGYFDGAWDDFLNSHAVDVTVSQTGWGEIRITSQTNGAKDGTWNWSRNYNGTVIYEGKSTVVDVNNNGTRTAEIGYSFSSYERSSSTTGTIVSEDVSVNVSESYWATLMHNSNTAQQSRNFKIRSGSSATYGGNTYQFTGTSNGMAWVEWETFTQLTGGEPDPSYHNVVSQADYWQCNGALNKNGGLWGQVQFNGPVIEETWGPDLVLNYVAGGSVLIHTLIDMP